MADSVLRFPIFLQRVHTNLPRGSDVGMENLGREPAFTDTVYQHASNAQYMERGETYISVGQRGIPL